MSGVHIYTSITANYLPKARVLAHSVKARYPSVTFHLVLSDAPPQGFDLGHEPFDTLVPIEDLGIDNLIPWVFGHTVVELCTAVKGAAMEFIFERHGADKVFYFDPDIAVFGRLEELEAALDQASIVLTPHQSEPEDTLEGIADNEIASLKHGVFNLGFVGGRNSPEGRRFARWWAERLYHFCHDDIPAGLFTDQRWIDLVPCLFEDYKVIRDPGFNVATWNLSHRRITGSFEQGFKVNDVPLGFYHFSGFDSGAQEVMLNKYGKHSPALLALRNWYIKACDEQGQATLGKKPSKFACFDDGAPITKDQRRLYRTRLDLQRAFPNPFASGEKGTYQRWFADNVDSMCLRKGLLTIAPATPYRDVFREFVGYTCDKIAGSHRLSRPVRWLGSRAIGLLAHVARLF